MDQGRQVDEPHSSPYCLILQVVVEPRKVGPEKGRRLRPLPTAAPNSEPQEPSRGEGGRKVDGMREGRMDQGRGGGVDRG